MIIICVIITNFQLLLSSVFVSCHGVWNVLPEGAWLNGGGLHLLIKFQFLNHVSTFWQITRGSQNGFIT